MVHVHLVTDHIFSPYIYSRRMYTNHWLKWGETLLGRSQMKEALELGKVSRLKEDVHMTDNMSLSGERGEDLLWMRGRNKLKRNQWCTIPEMRELWEDFFVFTFVRNPWDSVVSQWAWKLKLAGVSFEDYVDHAFRKPRRHHWSVPLRKWFAKPDDGNKESIDFVGRFENLQEDFNTVCDTIGVQRTTLPKKNKSEHKPYWEYYNERTKVMVERRYSWVVNRFGYKFKE